MNIEVEPVQLKMAVINLDFPKAWELTCPMDGCHSAVRVFCYLRETKEKRFNVNFNLGSFERHLRTKKMSASQKSYEFCIISLSVRINFIYFNKVSMKISIKFTFIETSLTILFSGLLKTFNGFLFFK
jgi:hypothetical protein